MRKLSLVLLMATCVAVANSQTMSNYAGANFSASSVPGAFVPLSGGTAVPALLVDDIASGPLPIGFTFYYMGKAYTQVRAGSDGYLSLYTSGTGSSITNALTSGTTVERPVLAPFWDDMDGRGTGAAASYITTGTPGSRVFTFEWLNWVRTGGTTPVMSFQVKLYENTGVIQFIYRSDAGALSGASASIGICAVATGAGNFVSLSDATGAPTTSTATETTSISTKPATDQVYTFTPPAAAVSDPTTMTFSAITLSGMTVNWVDNSTNETNFNVFRSTDGINYTWVAVVNSTTTAATGGAYNYVATGLAASTLYYWQVVASSEGVPSGALSGNQATGTCSIAGGTYTVGATGTYTSITNALTALVANGITGPIILELQTDYVPEGAVTYPLVPCASATNTITIRPAAAVAAPIVLTSAAAAPTFDINGGQYYIIDGRNGGSGTNKFITIANSSTTGQALRFINEGSNNIIRYCTIQGVNTSTSSGVVVFSTTTGAGGNDNNTIDLCDIRDGATNPVNGIYSSGTTTTVATNNSGNTVSNCNIFNYFSASGSDHYGINLVGGTTDWTMTGNSFYQTASRALTSSSTTSGIRISNGTSGNNFVITGNYIGGTAPLCGGTATTYTGTATVGIIFRGLQLSVGTTTATSVQGNTVQNINISTGSNSTSHSGFSLLTGRFNVGNITPNTIGSQSVTNSIVYVNSSTSTAPIFTGILAGTGTGEIMNIQNNTIGGIAVSTSSTGSVSVRGIGFQGSTGTYTVSGNTIGSTSTANSITNATNNSLLGIFGSASITSATQNITNNTVANIASTSTGTSGQVIGILAQGSTGGVYNTSQNTVRNLSSSAPNVGTSGSASVIGISHTAATTAGHTVSRNTIHTLSNTSAAASNISIAGIYYAGTTSGTNVVSRNLVYNLSLAATGAAPLMYGINVNNGLTTFQNNMIAVGTSVAGNIGIFGINDGVGTNNYYFNTVYVGGPGGFSGSLNTFAFNSSVTVNTRAFQNNIFVNERSNAGAGRSYAVQVAGTAPNPTGLTINYNDYYTSGAGTVLGRFNAVDQATIAAWRTATGQDANSISGNPQLIAPAAATPDLHIQPATPTEIEGAGLLIAGVTDDFDGDTRASFTPTDLGADAGNFISADLTPPAISYTLIPNTACLTNQTLSANITDLSGVNTTPGTKPRLYFKKSTDANTYAGNTSADNGWKYVEATNAASPFSFTTDYSLLQSPVATSDVIQYFVVAQDLAGTPLVGINNGTFAATPASVALTVAAFPIGGTINSYTIPPAVPTSVTIGAAGTYPTLTGPGGLFADINAKYLTGNTTATILDAAIAETGANALNAINYGCSGGPFTLTIKPNTGVTTVLSGSVAGPLININGADNVTFDGSNNGTSTKDMTISNTNTGGSVIQFINDATTNTVKNSIILGVNSSSSSGSIVFSTSTGASGNSGNTIDNNDIRDGATVPVNAIYSSGSGGAPNATNTITGNNIFNWTGSGVLVTATGNGNSWTVNNNAFYQTASRTTALSAVNIVSGGNSNTISNNSIGGSDNTRGGTAMTSSNSVSGIVLLAGTTTASSIQGNQIGNISATTTSATSVMINITGGNVNIGTTAGNIIGDAAAGSISSSNSVAGIANSGAGTVDIRNNTIRNLAYNAADFERLAGVYVTAGTVTVKGNTIRDFVHSGTSNTTTTSTFVPLGIYISTTTAGNLVEDNQIFNFSLEFNGANSTVAYPMHGIEIANVSSTGTPTVINRNKIYNFTTTRTGTTTAAPIITGIYAVSGAATYSNNFISLTQSTASTQPLYRGLLLESSGNNNVFFNSVLVSGTAAAANNTYGLYRTSTSGTQSILNNILSNQRSGTGNHFAIGTSSVTGWNASFSNYNDLHATNIATIGDWAGTSLTLTGWKAAQPGGSGGDANSFTELPAFVSATDLHIPNATATQIESGGTPAGGITTDIDSETRPGPTNTNGGGTQVDVGADEFDGTPASAMSYVSSTTTQANTSPVPRGTVNQQVIGIQVVTTGSLSPLDITSFTLNTNGSTAPVTDIANARLWYTGTSSTFATTTQYGTVVASPNGSFNITGTQLLSTGTNYFWLTYDVPCGAVISNVVDAECNSIFVGEVQVPSVQAPAGTRTIASSAGLSGTVTIGAAGTYPTLTGTGGLFEAINTNGVSGNLTANIMDAAITEPGTVALNTVTNVCGGPFTILIKPNTTSVLSGTVGTGAVIKLNGADNVTIDGSNSGGTDRSLTIRNTTTTTTGNAVIWLASPAAANGANNNTIKNCIIEGNSSTTSFTGIHTGGSTAIGLTTAGLENNNNNTINNNLFRKTIYGVTMFGFAAATPDQNNVISDNNFGTAVTGEGHSLLAINADRQSGLIVSGNEVQNVVNATNTSSTPFGGIRLLDFKNGLCFNNKVHDLAYTGTSTPKIYGIAMTNATYTTVGNPSNAQIYNNIVYRINSTGTSSVWNLTGILASAGYGDRILYNSVHLTGQLANSASGLAAAFANGDANITSVGSNIEVRNNSFSITGSSAVAGGNFWAYYTGATTLTGSVLNNNDLYCNGTNVTNNVGRFNSANSTTLAAWQAATGQDANSIAVDPAYNGTGNLVPQLGSPLVNAGTPIGGITTDITGFTRSVTTPTIGAYEQAGDAVGPVITYTVLPFTCATADRTLTATITDATGVPTTGALQPRIYFRKNAGSWFSNQGTLTTGTGLNGTWDFTITAATMGGVTTGDVVQYYVIAQDIAGTPNISSNPAAGLVATDVNTVTTPPTTPNSYTISTTLNGTYTVGAAGTYTTLTAAVNAYNTSCLTGPVVFELLDASYSTGETFPLQINANSFASSVNTLTIRPATGVAATVTASTSAIFKLNGADYVIIDGINSGGSTLTLSNTNTASGTTVVWIGSLGAGAGATNDTLRNCVVQNGTLGSSSVVNFGVFVGQTSGAANGEDNDNIAITGNTIRRCVIGIQTIGGTTAGQQNDNTFIDNNIIGDATAANSIGRYGMNVGQSTNATVSRNTIQNVITSDAAISSTNNATGIIISTGTTNSLFTRNNITGVKYTGTSGYGGKGFDISTGVTASNVTLSNNFVSDIGGDGWNALTSDAIIGIRITGTSGGFNLYHNTVNLTGSFAGNTSGTQSAALFINSAVTALDIRNNIFVASLDNTNTTSDKTWAINSAAANTAFTTINYNDYSVSGAAGVLGFLTADLVTLADIQTATAQDANSINVAPVFVSATDLHLVPASNCNLHRRGTPLAGVTVDFDNDTRSTTKPDMGADEIIISTTGTMTWTGAVSTDWFDVRNWANCEIPGPTSNVVINGSLPNYPNVSANVTINSLTLNTGSSLTAATGVIITLLSL